MGGTCIPSENHGADMELKRLFEEPYAGKPHVRFREGRTEKSDSVYSTLVFPKGPAAARPRGIWPCAMEALINSQNRISYVFLSNAAS